MIVGWLTLFWVEVGAQHCYRRRCQCSITYLTIDKIGIVGLTTENNNKEAKNKKVEDAQKESTLQPITKTKSKLDKELQEWEVESTSSG